MRLMTKRSAGVTAAGLALAAAAAGAALAPGAGARLHAAGTPGPCTTAQLAITAGLGPSPGLDHAGAALRFRDTGAPCTLHGYPRVTGLNAKGTSVTMAKATPRGYLGGLPSGTPAPIVTLQAGHPASAAVEWVAGPVPHTRCWPIEGFAVTPPGDTRTARVTFVSGNGYRECDLEVHPVLPGLTGLPKR